MISSSVVIPDAKQRERALDQRLSFIVQAPAGSGKTELLTQRFLKLLSHVSLPEEILAITFTKKASAEMRARIIKTLKKAAHDPEPTQAHEKMTWELAQKALQQDKNLHWNLLDNPNRLRIQTIDSFNASLIKFLPILSHFGAPPEITDSPTALYREAVQEFLTHLEENVAWADAIAQLLIHLDNDLDKVEKLLINILGKRDQWLRYMIVESDEESLRQQLEDNLAAVVTEALTVLATHFPEDCVEELLTLTRFAAGNLRLSGDVENAILNCLDITEFPSSEIDHKPLWQGICELLLTKAHGWRKRPDKDIGFPAPSGTKNKVDKALFEEMKKRHTALIEKLSSHSHLHSAILSFRHAPEEIYEESQWQTLYALYQVLRIVVAQLNLVFRQHGKIDYIENAQAALFALGNDENPTDLALALDYQIKHILIDEFQDTSNTQYELIKKLTAGWQPNDGRTLFVVGDPMQSIYRFREAEVGLFIRARQHGIGHIKLEPLTLAVNFRSTSTVVKWINDHFQTILPPHEDVNTGAVSYSHSIANTTTDTADSIVKIHTMTSDDKSAQAQSIVALIQQKKIEKPHESIAILVRARTHLEYIIPALKNANLTYRAIKIDPLGARTVIQDLMALTRALAHPADRVAWLAILRAPWCGLSLNDLWLLAGKHPQHTLIEMLQAERRALSADGQKRLARVLPVLTHKVAERQRYPLAQWVESTWLLLGGPACLSQDADLEDVTAYFNLLATLDDGGLLSSEINLTDEVNKLFAAPNNNTDNDCQIMTIHNAKGLEFDTVILPHLEKQAPNDDKQLLLWMEKPLENSQNRLILAPVHAIGADNDSIYDHIKHQHAAKTDHETGRLLYVAATRAKKHLHLFLTHYSENQAEDATAGSKSKSLLKKLLPAIQNSLGTQEPFPPPAAKNIKTSRPIQRLTSDWSNSIQEIPADPITRHQNRPGFKLTQDYPKIIGTVVHKILENIACQRISWWLSLSVATRSHYIKSRLTQAGIAANHLSQSEATVRTAINNTINDSRGQWILDAHTDSKTEVQLTALLNGEVIQLVIDRTFIDSNGVRWIIDYKTSFYDGDNLEKFLTAEHAEYTDKMEMYHHAMRQQEERSIKLGLYFPLLSAWREWEIS
jgi:ATP-dependent helicase/nuclease subunit A